MQRGRQKRPTAHGNEVVIMEGVYYDGKGNLLGIADLMDEDIKRIVEYYGPKRQKSKAVEELVELTEVIVKDINKAFISIDDLYSEIADVEIMIRQLKLIFNLDDEMLDDEMHRKVARTLNRIRMEQENLRR